MRVVFDTNIYISAFLFPGSYPEFIVHKAMQGAFELYISDFIAKEFKKILVKKFKLTPTRAGVYIKLLKSFTITINTKSKISLIKSNRADNKILDLAVDAKADYLVTGDKKHLLSLKKYDDTRILSAKEFSEFF